MQIKLESIMIQNFKGIKSLSVDFGDVTQISGRNGSGKTTIADAFSWLLFDKDTAGSSTFAIRPKDSDGKDVDNVEISVTGTLNIDGEILTLAKTQKQKWTKHRGSTAPTFEGNVNEFQINGFPAKKSEYEQKIHSLIDESLFKLLTNPRTFAAMKWQDQRKTLMEFVSDVTDESILDTDFQYNPIRDDVLAAGADKAREKANVALRSLKKTQAEYPIRIDEASRSISDNIDESYVLKAKEKAEKELKAIQNERNSVSTASNVVADIQSQITQKKLRMGEIERSAAYEDAKQNGKAQADANNAMMECRKVESERDVLANKRNYIDAAIKDNEFAMEEIRVKFKAQKESTFPESETICPTCGRPFDADRIREMKSTFDANKRNLVNEMKKKGDALWEKIKSQKAELESINKRIAGLTADVEGLNAKWEELKEIAAHPVRTDFTADPEYKQLAEECRELIERTSTLDGTDSINKELSDRESTAREMLDAANADLAQIEANRKLHERIEELKAEQMECGQKVADQEQIVYLLDTFMMAKMNLLSDRINQKFCKVRFKLWEQLINGGIKETCVMQINSNGSYVDFPSANNAARIIGGLDVIEALSGLYGVYAPIFLDNSEAIDSYNTPDTEAQLILLEVSDDQELVVERG